MSDDNEGIARGNEWLNMKRRRFLQVTAAAAAAAAAGDDGAIDNLEDFQNFR